MQHKKILLSGVCPSLHWDLLVGVSLVFFKENEGKYPRYVIL